MTALRVFVPFALGYFLSYLLRVVNAVIAPDLVSDLGLTAADLGLLTSASFFAFALAQLPLGILLDRYGPRRMEAGLLVFAGLGAFIFATADGVPGLIAGRALIGLGTSACLMAAIKAYVMWFPISRLPLINGLHMAAGGLGAITGTVPVEAALGVTDWRGLFFVFGGLALAMSVLVFAAVPKRDGAETSTETLGDQLAGLRQILTSPLFWRIAPMTVASQSMFLGTQSLWSGPWLSDVAGLQRDAVADHLLLIGIAMVAGFLGMGAIAERLGRIGVKTTHVAFFGMALFWVVQIPMALQWTGAVLPMWMAFGFFGTCGILSYAALPRNFAPALSGRVITGLNVFTFMGAFAVQWGMGIIINLWPVTASGSYAPEGYQAAFWVMFAIQAAGLSWFWIYRKAPV
ncbi:MAG: MFS transporter [Rhodospirillales bacterium]|nr:MFS transporter [Rhodospirillales bacterium]